MLTRPRTESRPLRLSFRWSDRRLAMTAPTWPATVVRHLWRGLISLKLALAIILALAILTVAGTSIEQMPPSLASNHIARVQWLASAHERYGPLTSFMDRLSLFDIFHSFALRLLLALLAVSLAACTIHRWPRVWSSVFHTPVRPDDALFEDSRHVVLLTTSLPPVATIEQINRQFSAMRFRVRTANEEATAFMLGERRRFSQLGTLAVHAGLLLVLAGVLVGRIWGFQNPAFIISEGDSSQLGLGTGIAVRLNQFSDQYYPDGRPRDFQSNVTVFDNGREAGVGTIRVNTPLRYKGVAFHQSFWGESAIVSIADPGGITVFQGSVPLAWHEPGSESPLGSVQLPGDLGTVSVIGPGSGTEPASVPAGEIRIELYRNGQLVDAPSSLAQGQPAEVAGLTFTFLRESRYVGFKVVKDPGMLIVWIAAGLMILGLVVAFFLPPQRFWVRCAPRLDGITEVRIAVQSRRHPSLNGGLTGISKTVAIALGDIGSSGDGRNGSAHA